MVWIPKWSLWRSPFNRPVKEMGQAISSLHCVPHAHEDYCSFFVPFVSLDIGFWRLGFAMDGWQLSTSSGFCHADVSLFSPQFPF